MIDEDLLDDNVLDESENMIDDRQYEDEDKEASKEFIPDGELDEEEPWTEPECSKFTEEDDIECEFENKDGSWWCTTHNCWA
jgi:hypothetical protein